MYIHIYIYAFAIYIYIYVFAIYTYIHLGQQRAVDIAALALLHLLLDRRDRR